MALSDTLRQLHERRQREQQIAEDTPKSINEWRKAVRNLLTKIRSYISNYEDQGYLSVVNKKIRLNEPTLGAYEIAAIDIKVGSISITVEPVGLMVIGATGRVDMHRQGRSGEQDRAMLLRYKPSPDAEEFAWQISPPAERPDNPWASAAVRLETIMSPRPRQYQPLTQASFEQAFERLLK